MSDPVGLALLGRSAWDSALGWPDIALLAILAGTGLAIAVIDARSRIIPDTCNLLVALTGLAFRARGDDLVASVGGGLAGFALFWLFRAGYRHLRGRHGLGLGDVKFLGAAGLWVGLGGLAPLMLVACLAALIYVLVQRWHGRALGRETAVPFGPFLVIGLLGVVGAGLA